MFFKLWVKPNKLNCIIDACGYVRKILFSVQCIFYCIRRKISVIGLVRNKPIHRTKNVHIRSFFWSVFSRIQTEYGKIKNRKNSAFGHFTQ